MLKCGQTDNTHYTFGIKKEDENTIQDVEQCDAYCSKCGEPLKSFMHFCSSCGNKVSAE